MKQIFIDIVPVLVGILLALFINNWQQEKISALAERLPSTFIRIHRSFLVNSDKISSYNAEEVRIGDLHLPIGRKYKKQVAAELA